MSEVLSQAEIDQLLTAVNENVFENIGAFEDYLTKRKFTPEKPYGIFDKDIAICRFFNSDKNEKLLFNDWK
jgi:flagellar motor switch protein FliM